MSLNNLFKKFKLLKEIDKIIKAYKESIDAAVKINSKNCIALKVSSFANVNKMKRFNEIQFLLELIEQQYLLTGYEDKDVSNYINLIEKYNIRNISELTHNDINNLIDEIQKANFDTRGNSRLISFDLNIHEVLLGKKLKNSFFLSEAKNNAIEVFIKKVFNISEEEFSELSDYCFIVNNRLNEVFLHAINKNCSIMVDAEQSYIQHYIDYLTAHLFKIYNKEDSIMSTTLQCYLKKQICKMMQWFEFCRENNLKVGIKLVRGAYLNEERKLAEEGEYPSPVCDNIELTHKNYNESLKYLFENLNDKEKVKFNLK